MVVRIRTLRQRPRTQRRALFLEPLETRDLLASFTTPEDTPLVVTDAALKITAIEGLPAHGKATVITGGGFSYSPAENYNGSDSFTYSFNENGANALAAATVVLSITPVNDAPVAVNDSFSAPANGAQEMTSAKILANDTDVDGNALTVMLQGGSGPSHGTLTTSASGNFVYKPAAQFVGSDSFTYFAWDGQAFSATAATVTIKVEQVNLPPEARNDTFIGLQGKTLTIQAPGVLANDGSPNQALVATLVNGPAHGTLTFNANGGFTYVPTGDFTGADTFTYKAIIPSTTADPTTPVFSNTATVTVNVKPLNTSPVALNDVYTMPQDATLTIQAPGVLANDLSVGGASLTASIVDLPTHGAVTFNTNGSLTYFPLAGFSGADSFTYRATAAASNTDPSGTTTSNLATVTIYVKPLNEPPKANNDQYAADQNKALTIGAPGVLANDKGGTQEKPLYGYADKNPVHGKLTLKPNGSFTYTPDADYSGLDSFTYRASTTPPESASPILEGSVATVTIYVKPVNSPPEARNDTFLALQDSALTILPPGVLANDGNLNGAIMPLTAAMEGKPSHGSLTLNASGGFTYVPDAGFNGADSFTYRASAAASNSDPTSTTTSNLATVTINVKPLNLPPLEAHNDYYFGLQGTKVTLSAPGVLINDGLAPTRPLAAVLVTGPAHGTVTLNVDGSFAYVPDGDFSGDDSFTYQASELTDPASAPATTGSTATVTIKVLALNNPPIAHNDQYGTLQGSALTVAAPGVLTNDGSLITNDKLSAELVTSPAHGTLSLNADGGFTYVPTGDFSGVDSFVYRSNDSAGGLGNSSTATVTIVVAKLNPLHNAAKPNDVDGNSEVAPIDALLIINYLNGAGSASGESAAAAAGGYFDVDNNGAVAPLDALLVINWLNASQTGGAGENAATGEGDADNTLALLAFDAAEEAARRRRTS